MLAPIAGVFLSYYTGPWHFNEPVNISSCLKRHRVCSLIGLFPHKAPKRFIRPFSLASCSAFFAKWCPLSFFWAVHLTIPVTHLHLFRQRPPGPLPDSGRKYRKWAPWSLTSILLFIMMEGGNTSLAGRVDWNVPYKEKSGRRLKARSRIHPVEVHPASGTGDR